MKKILFTVSLIVASSMLLAAPTLAKKRGGGECRTRTSCPTPPPLKTGPRQFIQSVALSNGVGATITVVADWSEETRIQSVIDNILSDLSRTDQEVNGETDGELVKVNGLQKGQQITLSDEFYDLISKARNLAYLTNGWFDITESPSRSWFSAKNYRRIKLNSEKKTFAFKAKDMQIDISMIWPAYLVDTAMGKLTAEGIANAKVEVGNVNRNIGQDIYTPWNVSVDIPNPNSANAYRSYVYSFSNRAVASLVPGRLSNQIIDPRNNKPVSNTFKNVTVFGGDSMTASAFAVALYTLGPKDAMAFAEAHPEVKGIFVDDGDKPSSSRDLTITHPNYSAEEEPVPSVDRGPNDIRQKQREEARD